jgi:hypothetical protein
VYFLKGENMAIYKGLIYPKSEGSLNGTQDLIENHGIYAAGIDEEGFEFIDTSDEFDKIVEKVVGKMGHLAIAQNNIK